MPIKGGKDFRSARTVCPPRPEARVVLGGAPKSKMKSLSLGIRAMRSTALGASRRELMRVRLSCWVFTFVFVGGVAVKFVEEEVGKERVRVERRLVRRSGVIIVSQCCNWTRWRNMLYSVTIQDP